MNKQELEQVIKQANYNYYINGTSDLSDDEYDGLVNQLKQIDPNNSLFKKVGDDDDNSIDLPVKMGSQEKIRIGEQVLSEMFPDRQLMQMAKLDGLSMLVVFEDGKFSKMYSRGNGLKGQDITARGQLMNFPKSIKQGGTVYLTGEAVISSENFTKVQGNYKHARNFVGGTLRPVLSNEKWNQAEEVVKKNCSLIDFVLWDSPSADQLQFETLEDVFKDFESQGFITCKHQIVNNNDLTDEKVQKFIEFLKSDKYPYLCDGAVFKINNCSEFHSYGYEANGLNPKGSRAVKLALQEQLTREGEIDFVEWNISKRGIFVPLVHLKEALDFDGASVNKVSGVNYNYVVTNGWCKGTKVLLIRSGDVIPRIISSTKDQSASLDIPTVCPYCGNQLKNDGTILYCDNENCCGKHREQTIAFFNTLELDGVGGDTIGNLYDNHFDSIEKLLTVTYDQLKQLPGYQATSALKVSKLLNSCLKGITLAKLMECSQCFLNEKGSLGLKRLQLIVETLGEQNVIDNLENKVDQNGEKIKLQISTLREVNGLGDILIDLFKSGYTSFKQVYNQVKPYIQLKVKQQPISGKLSGMQFCFTGFRNSKMEEIIISNGGEVGGLTKKTTILFFAESGTGKYKKAMQYGTKCVTMLDSEKVLNEMLS